MAVQFAGSGATGNRRRRRIVVSGDGSGVDAALPDGEAGEIESQLVASAAAAPWVPVSEMRIWIYSALIAAGLGVLIFALACPAVFHADLLPLTDHLLTGPRPTAVVFVETAFLALATQLGLLIGWYRARCKLDFGGRYRVWPWVVGLAAMAAFCLATNTHRALGEVIDRVSWLSWRGHVVAWLLPFCVAALPISLLLDRDVRNSRSSLFTLRLSGLLWLAEACLEIYQPELQAEPWFPFTHLLIPLFASATLFIGLWHHARVVAYVCPDPPQLEERSAWSVLSGGVRWIAGWLVFWRKPSAHVDDDDDAKPKRRRKKVEGEETATKRKRKPPVKRAAPRTRSRVKAANEGESEEMSDDTTGEEPSDEELEALTAPTSVAAPPAKSSWNKIPEPEPEDDEEDEESVAPIPPKQAQRSDGRFTQVHKSHGGSAPAPHARKQAQSWKDESENEDQQVAQPSNDSSDESDDDEQFQQNSGLSNEQMKGLSKRQKRDLKKQLRDQERTRGR